MVLNRVAFLLLSLISEVKMGISFREEIEERARELGFNAVGFARAGKLEDEAVHLHKYLSEGRQAGMDYLLRNREKLPDPTVDFPEVQSIIVCLLSYQPAERQNPECSLKISAYAYGNDYHIVIKEKLNQLSDFIREKNKVAVTKVFCDSGTVLEKAWAIRAGLGWRGKNSLVLHPRLGPFFFIGLLMTNLDLPVVPEIMTDKCGKCTLCLESCPTRALDPYMIDPRKCISYHTIENKGDWPEGFTTCGWIYGCDICQEVCPWNKDVLPATEKNFRILPFIHQANDQDWLSLDEKSFNEIFSHSAIRRMKFSGLKNNITRVVKK